MKNLDCNQIKIFINLEIIGEESLYIYIYIKFKKILKKICTLEKPLDATMVSKPNFYYIVYDLHSYCSSFVFLQTFTLFDVGLFY